MMPILYEANETEFTSLGIGPLVDAIKCVVTEELNGEYELEITYPVSGVHYSELVEDRLICAVPFEGGRKQIFKIYEIEKPLNGEVVVRAEHIHYLLNKMVVIPFSASSAPEAMSKIKANVVDECPFTFSTDKTLEATFKMTAPIECGKLLGGTEGSILDVYGPGDYEFDNFDVIFHANRGSDNGVSVRYGKNMTELNASIDTTNVYTGILPYYKDSEDRITYADGYVVWSEHKSDYIYPMAKVVDMSASFDSEREHWEAEHPDEIYAPTSEQLISKATSYLDKNTGWEKNTNIKVSFVNLWQSDEYADLAVLERVKLGDTVTVIYNTLGVSTTKKVIKTEYNVLLDRYDSIELGDKRSSMVGEIAETSNAIEKATTETQSMMDKAIDYATKLITGGLGGYVIINTNANGKPNEILIMDTPNKETAVNVWRFNLNGLGHSHSGYNGPFDDIALTQDGKINATMITAGVLNANRIQAGILTDKLNNNYWNLDTGDFRLSAATTVGGSTVQKIADDAADNAQTAAEQAAAAALADAVRLINLDINDLQEQIDGNVTTWYYPYVPTLSNVPASQWTTVVEKNNHIGDLFYNKDTGYCYRFMLDGTTYKWVQISDEDIAAALEAANHAQDTADGKRRVFVSTPVPPYDIGDLWSQGSTGDLLRCATAKAEGGSYSASDWVKASKYTDDAAFEAFRDGSYATFVTNTNNAIGTKITTFYQSSEPTANVVGDLWIDMDDGNKLHRWNGTKWTQVQDAGIQSALTAASNAQSTADGKIVTFAQNESPTATDIGDLWIDTDNNNKMYRWNGSIWVPVTDISALQTWITGTYNNDKNGLQAQIDGKAETWYQSADPSLAWDTDTKKESHLGDLWYKTYNNENTTWFYTKEGSTYKWVQQNIPTEVFDEIDGKAQIFISQPVPPYNVGDLWCKGTTGDILTCTTARASGSFNSGDWTKQNKYTDDSSLTSFINGSYATFVTNTNNALNGKITTYYQAPAPTTDIIGDLWIDTDDGNKLYRWNGSQWVAVQDADIQSALTAAANAQATADGKIVTFAQSGTPTATDIGDLWIKTDANNQMYRWNGSNWIAYTDTSALSSWISNTYNSDKTNLQSQIDGKAETWYQATDPSVDWNTSALKGQHVGDLWYKTTDGTTWFYSSSYTWVQENVPNDVFDKIDGKAQVFTSQPTTPYNIGDIWFEGASGDIKTCVTAREAGSYISSDWQKKNKYTDDSAFTSFRDGSYATFVSSTNTALNSKITTYYQAAAPTATVVGDLWIDTDDGNKLHRWNGTEWTPVQDAGIQSALSAASNAQSTADGKIVTFAQGTQPTATDIGDLWIDTAHNNKLYRWSGSAWVSYTDTSALNDWITNTYSVDKVDLKSQIDSKAETWYQSNDPANEWTTAGLKEAHVGDLWYKTSDNTTWYYQKNGSTYKWVQQNIPDDVFDEIDGKAQIFVSQPTPPYSVGDLWCEGANGDILTCVTAKAKDDSYSANDWQKKNKYIDTSAATSAANTAVSNYDTSLNQQKVFNKLTNNGALQGIYMEDGVLYINAEYIVSGIITDKTQTNYWDLDNGLIHLGANTQVGSYTIATSFDIDTVYGDVISEIATLEQQTNAMFANYTGEVKPTKSNAPANTWTTDALKKQHAGDVYYDTVAEKYYQWYVRLDASTGAVTSSGWTEKTGSQYDLVTTTTDSKIEQTMNSFEIAISAETNARQNADIASTYNYSGNYIPTSSNDPAANWTTTEMKKSHVGEVFYNSNAKTYYLYDVISTDNYGWVSVSADKVFNLTTKSNEARFKLSENEIVLAVEEMETELDGMFANYTGTVVPTTSNYPASSWDLTDWSVAKAHEGEVYLNTATDTYYRFAVIVDEE